MDFSFCQGEGLQAYWRIAVAPLRLGAGATSPGGIYDSQPGAAAASAKRSSGGA